MLARLWGYCDLGSGDCGRVEAASGLLSTSEGLAMVATRAEVGLVHSRRAGLARGSGLVVPGGARFRFQGAIFQKLGRPEKLRCFVSFPDGEGGWFALRRRDAGAV